MTAKHLCLRFFCCLVLLVSFTACDLIFAPNDSTNETATSRLRFDTPAIGQKSTYIALRAKNYFNPDSIAFEYLTDTLVVEIVDQTDDFFVINEYLTPGSASRHGMGNESFPDSTFTYQIKVTGGTLRVMDIGNDYVQSRLFQFYNRTVPLNAIAAPEVDIRGWKTSFPYCECYNEGFTTNYEQLARRYDRLNVVMDDVDMQLDGVGHTFLYSKKYGLVRKTVVSWWTQEGQGWDLL